MKSLCTFCWRPWPSGMFSGRAAAADPAAEFNAANKLYAEGKFAEAAGTYEKILQSGAVSPALYFNYANAEFKSGNLGPGDRRVSPGGATGAARRGGAGQPGIRAQPGVGPGAPRKPLVPQCGMARHAYFERMDGAGHGRLLADVCLAGVDANPAVAQNRVARSYPGWWRSPFWPCADSAWTPPSIFPVKSPW